MGRASRDKGKRGEREVVRRFNDAGIPCRRRWEGQSMPGGLTLGDLMFGPERMAWPIYAEVRHRNTLAIPAWLREIEESAPLGYERTLIFRRDKENWHVAMPLSDYISLLREARGI